MYVTVCDAYDISYIYHLAAISRGRCGVKLHLEDHSGGMGESTGVRLSPWTNGVPSGRR